jgi:hypothetical protein
MPKLFLLTIEVYYLLHLIPILPSYLTFLLFFTGLILFLALEKEGGILSFTLSFQTNHTYLIYLSRTKKTVTVDVVVVNCVMGLKGWEKGKGGKKQGVGQLLPGKGPEWIGIATTSKASDLQVSRGFLFFLPFHKGVFY